MADSSTNMQESSVAARVSPVSERSAISTIKRQLDGGGDTITLSRDEALALVQRQARPDAEMVQKLEEASSELCEVEYKSQLGDYAGRVVDWVMKSTAKKNDLPSTVSKLKEALMKEISTNPERDGKANRVKKDQDRLLRLLHNEERRSHVESWRKIIDFYPQSQELAFIDDTRRKLRVAPIEDVRQLASTDRITAFDNGKFRQNLVLEPDVAKIRQRTNSDPISESVPIRKRRTSGSLGPDSTESAGHGRGRARRKLTKSEAKFVMESDTLVNRIHDWHDKNPRPALKWVQKANRQLEEDGK
ncbi:hypothetical protein MGYG_08211 [Nannizzia gypsea CBS 118893]|uniref:Uncharacterized protein n=1 Tax=Arthroderma gypseum (strain ATCC MYA-4604 / CBS 118893) TaxID=535722 RepID=E4V5C3_ARTGP|nr:hypothetical protein MGYG_08211 [Nannizzia gypsea CBS 118893]EFR05197.1 hypothetical protein MGYG_08211 [Nannizzia gypsea CBS 118893]